MNNLLYDNGGGRSGIDRRHFLYNRHIPERGSGKKRRIMMHCFQINQTKNIVILFITIIFMIPFFLKVSNASEAYPTDAYTLDDFRRIYQEYEQKESEIWGKIGPFRSRGEWESESAYEKEKMAHDEKRVAAFNKLSFPIENKKFKLRMDNCHIVQERADYRVDDQQLSQFNITCRECVPRFLSEIKNNDSCKDINVKRAFGGHSYTLRLPSGERVTYSLPEDGKILMLERLKGNLSGTIIFKTKLFAKIFRIFGIKDKHKYEHSFACPIQFAKYLKPLIAIGSPVGLELEFSNKEVQKLHVIYKETKILSVQ